MGQQVDNASIRMFLCLSLWCYMFLFVALSSESGLNFKIDDNSTVRYQLGANTVRNYDNERDLIWYNLNENSIKDNGDIQYTYCINSTRNNHENDDENYEHKNLTMFKLTIFKPWVEGWGVSHIRDQMIDHLIHPKLQAEAEKNYHINNFINLTRNNHEDDDENYDEFYGNEFYDDKNYDDENLTMFESTTFKPLMRGDSAGHIRYRMRNRLFHRIIQTEAEQNYKNDNQIPMESHAISQKMLKNLKMTNGKNGSTSHDFFKNFTKNNDKNNIVLYKMCENITCIRFCCPFGDRLVDGKCLAKQNDFIRLQNMYEYIDEPLQNGNERINELFLLVVDDPCQKTKYDLIMSFDEKELLINGSLYLASNKIIVESTSYCFAVVEQNIFAVKVCPKIIERVMHNNYKNRNKNAIIPISANEELKKIKDKNDSMSYNSFKNFNKDNNKNNIISYKMCENITCIPLCCPFGKRLVDKKCIAGQDNFIFLQNMYKYINDSLQKGNEGENELFLLVVRDPCQKSEHYTLNLLKSVFLVNGSLYLPDNNTIVESTSYCLANVDDQFDMDGFGAYGLTVNVCFENIKMNKTFEKINFLETELIIYICSLIGVILCLLVTFVVYSIVPELRNIHGYILRSYSGSLIVVYTVELENTVVTRDAVGDSICIAYAFVKYYLFLGSCFWLNVMNFDMWRTFRKLCPLQRNTKQQERKKLIIYSVFAWGSPFMLAVICGIMEFVPGVPKNFRPRFDINCWFNNQMAYSLYFHGIETISIISSIYLFICMAQNIAHYEKAIAHCLRDSENRRYNNNNNCFDLQLKICIVLFTMMCIKLVMVTVIITINTIYMDIIYMDIIYMLISCTFSTLDFIQHFCIFIIFVWKRKIKLLLLKRFGC